MNRKKINEQSKKIVEREQQLITARLEKRGTINGGTAHGNGV